LLALEHAMGTDSPAPTGSTGSIDSPLDVAEATFRLLSCAPGGLVLDCTGLHHDLPQRPVLLVELRELLCTRSVCPHAVDDVVGGFVGRAGGGGGWWLIGAVGMALPALRGIAGTLSRDFHAGDPHDLDTEILTGFLEALRSIDLARPAVRPRLCDAARRAG